VGIEEYYFFAREVRWPAPKLFYRRFAEVEVEAEVEALVLCADA